MGGLPVLVKSTRGKSGQVEYAVNTWQGKGFLRHIGLRRNSDGVLLVVGSTQSKSNDALLFEAVNSIVGSAMLMQVIGR